MKRENFNDDCFGEYPNCELEVCHHRNACTRNLVASVENIMATVAKKENKQKNFLYELERLCKVNKGIFIDRNVIQWQFFEKEKGEQIDIWQISEERLCWAKDIANENIVGRYKIVGANSAGVWEFWFDIESNLSLDSTSQVNDAFKSLKKATETVVETLIKFKIPSDHIFIKSSGRGFHVHVFIEGIRDDKQYQEWARIFVAATGLPNVKSKEYKNLPDLVFGLDSVPVMQTVRKIREFGGINDKLGQFHYCSLIPYDKFKKLKAYPFVLEPEKVVYPVLKVFKPTTDFLRKMSEAESEETTKDFRDTGPVNYDLEGDPEKLFMCPLVAEIEKQAKEKHHLSNTQRVFLSQLFVFFGERGEKLGRKIIEPCSDYDQNYTQYQFDCVKRSNKRPITCEWAKKNVGCPECKGSDGKSPIKFAWKPKSLEELKATFNKWLNLRTEKGTIDDEVIDVVLAAAFDRQIEGNEKFWLFIVARSGGVKTSLIKSLSKLPFVYTIDSITPKTLVSGVVYKEGEKRVQVGGIMKKLDKKTLVVKDFTIILTKPAEERNEVFSDFRNAYDGYLDKGFGTSDEKIHIDAHFGLVAACTPIIDNYWQLNQLLGERFLKIRHEIDDTESTKVAIKLEGKENAMDKELQDAVFSFYKGIDFKQEVTIPENVRTIVLYLSLFIARMRTPLMSMNQDGHSQTFSGEPEYATRIAKQFMRILRLLCYVRGHNTTTPEDVLTLLRVAFSTPPLYRTKIVAYLCQNKTIDPYNTAKIVGCDRYTGERVLNELQHIKIVKGLGDGRDVRFTPAFLMLLDTLTKTLSVVLHGKQCGKSIGKVRGSGEKREEGNNLLPSVFSQFSHMPCDAKKKDNDRAVQGKPLDEFPTEGKIEPKSEKRGDEDAEEWNGET